MHSTLTMWKLPSDSPNQKIRMKKRRKVLNEKMLKSLMKIKLEVLRNEVRGIECWCIHCIRNFREEFFKIVLRSHHCACSEKLRLLFLLPSIFFIHRNAFLLNFLQGTPGRCPPLILFVRTYVVVLEKLSDTYFFLRAQNGL